MGAQGWVLLVPDRVSSTKPSPGLCRAGANRKGKKKPPNMFVRYFSLANYDFCRKCLSAENFQKEKKHTHRMGLCKLKTKSCQTFPAPRCPPPRRNIGRRWGREARKLLKKNINENQTLSASCLISKGKMKGSLPCPLDSLLTPG